MIKAFHSSIFSLLYGVEGLDRAAFGQEETHKR